MTPPATDEKGRVLIHAGNVHLTLSLTILLALCGAVWAARGKMESLVTKQDLAPIKADLSTSLRVLADHGTELQEIRTEQGRIRARSDELWSKVDDQTRSRFTREDAAADRARHAQEHANERRILELELKALKQPAP